MELKDRLHVGKLLIELLQEQTARLTDPLDDELPTIIKKAIVVKLRMRGFYMNNDQPPEMLEQLEAIDKIIKSMTELQNKGCY